MSDAATTEPVAGAAAESAGPSRPEPPPEGPSERPDEREDRRGDERADEPDRGQARSASEEEPAPRPAPTAHDTEAAPASEPLRVVEPPQPRRIRRPVDLARIIFGLSSIALLVLLGELLLGTTTGLAQDIFAGGRHAPALAVNIAGAVGNIAVIAVPVLLALVRLVGREGRRVLDGLIAAALGEAGALGINAAIRHAGHHHFTQALTQAVGTTTSDAIHTYLVVAVAFITVVDVSANPRWQVAAWAAIGLDGVEAVIAGDQTPLALLITIAFGWTVANVVRYGLGTTNTRPDGYAVARALGKVGIDVVHLTREDARDDDARRYAVRTRDGQLLDATVLDRDMQAAGIFYRIWRRVRVRGEVRSRSTLSLQRTIEHEAFLAYAAVAAGVRTPPLVAVTETGPEAAILAFERLDGRRVPELEPDELTDAMMAAFWVELGKLRARRIAHRRLTGDVLVAAPDGSTWLSNMRAGEAPASELSIRLDVAQLLTTFALVVGPQRAVSSAAATIGTEALAGAMPLLQPVALPRTTRAALREQGKGELLKELREEILQTRPRSVPPEVRLERIRPRTILMTATIAVAVYLLLPNLTRMHLSQLRDINVGWGIAALGASALTYVAAALSIHGFVTERLNSVRLFLVQVAASFIMVVAPAAVGGVAVNARFMERSGIPRRLAVASVGLSQIVGLASHLAMIVLFAFLAGTQSQPTIAPSTTLIVLALVLAGAVLLMLAVGPLRRYTLRRVGPFFQGVLPRILDILQRPSRMAAAIAGTWLMSLAYIVCLYFCVLAFGVHADFAKVSVAFLAGQAVGSVVPTPGGIGGVEYAITLGLTGVAGLDAAHAASTVLLFRLVSFWLPILPGWLCFAYLQRKNAL